MDKNCKEICYFHPKESNIVGVCHLCLYEKLLILANNQSSNQNLHGYTKIFQNKIFSFGSLIHHRKHSGDSRHRKHSGDSYSGASTSQEDSFISIKFENNGVGSWDKGKISSKENPRGIEAKTVVGHVQARAKLRWRNRIGHIFQVIKLKRSSKGSVCHVGSKEEGVKVKNSNNKGWIRNLTKRRTKG